MNNILNSIKNRKINDQNPILIHYDFVFKSIPTNCYIKLSIYSLINTKSFMLNIMQWHKLCSKIASKQMRLLKYLNL
jgi:hypothetical protein